MSRAEEDEQFLLCRAGGRIGALRLEDIQETLRPLPVEPLPGAPPFVLGAAILRGSPTPVIDLGHLLGSSTASPTRFISIKIEERTAALAVDAVIEIRSLPKDTLGETPPLLREADRQLVSLIGALDAKLVVVLEAARLVPESVWNALNPVKGTG